MKQDQNSFMDRNTIMAIVIVFVFFIGWQEFIKWKYPAPVETAPVATNATLQEVAQPAATMGSRAAAPEAGIREDEEPFHESLFTVSTPLYQVEVSNLGMGFKSIILKNFTDREDQPVKVGDSSVRIPFATYITGSVEPVLFDVERVSEFEFRGQGRRGEAIIEKTLKFDPELFSVEMVTKVDGAREVEGIWWPLSDLMVEFPSHFLLPSYEHQDFFAYVKESEERTIISPDKAVDEVFQGADIVSLSSPYFTLTTITRSEILPDARFVSFPEEKRAQSEVIYRIPPQSESFVAETVGYFGPKSYDLLKAVDPSLVRVIDFGFFASLAELLLRLLKWFETFVRNWGVAIILLTILVRLVVLPFNLSSYKSMKKMQKMQEPMKALREKYKDDPQRMNLEVMQLMKREKANPLGGCLPMLLQLPVFFALYQVFGKSIELYKAPFGLWIQDLSQKDPYYVLPLLLAGVMFFQQKITPNTMDATQRKIMLFLPLLFALLMLTLPSGLVLYMFVSALFGIIQQLVFMRDRPVAVKNA